MSFYVLSSHGSTDPGSKFICAIPHIYYRPISVTFDVAYIKRNLMPRIIATSINDTGWRHIIVNAKPNLNIPIYLHCRTPL